MYIDNIVNHAYKKLRLIKKLKFTLCRNKLSKIYVTFVRPIPVIWGGCSISETEKLEKVQLYAARIVTGLPILALKKSLYFENGCEPLCERRRKSKLTTMYKIHTNTVTQYLYDTIANFQKKMYNSRNEEMYIVPKCRLDIFKKSFIPDDICKWNALPNDVHVIKSSTLGQFRRGISNVISKIALLQCISILEKACYI